MYRLKPIFVTNWKIIVTFIADFEDFSRPRKQFKIVNRSSWRLRSSLITYWWNEASQEKYQAWRVKGNFFDGGKVSFESCWYNN